MHIGIITGEFPPMEGGVGDYTLELSTALVDSGHTVDILTSSNTSQHISTSTIQLKVAYDVRKVVHCGSYPDNSKVA